MILEFSVENIFSIKERQTLSFELKKSDGVPIEKYFEKKDGTKILKVACIYGYNASGKTNLMRALDYFLYMTLYGFNYKATSKLPMFPFKFSMSPNTTPSSFALIFYADEIRYTYNLSLFDGVVVYEKLSRTIDNKSRRLYERKADKVIWSKETKGTKKAIIESLRDNCTVLNTAAQFHNETLTPIYSKLDGIFFAQNYVNEIINDWDLLKEDEWMKTSLTNLLKAAGLGEVIEISAQKKQMTDSMMSQYIKEDKLNKMKEEGIFDVWDPIFTHEINGQKYDMGIDFESNGVRRFIYIMKPILMALKNQGFIAIDELEHSLHSELLEFILSVFMNSSNGAQLMIATHSLSLLESNCLDSNQLWFAIKDPNAVSSYKRLTDIKGYRKDVNRLTIYKKAGDASGYKKTDKMFTLSLLDTTDVPK